MKEQPGMDAKLQYCSIKRRVLLHEICHELLVAKGCVPELLDELEEALQGAVQQSICKQCFTCKAAAFEHSCSSSSVCQRRGLPPSEDEKATAGGHGSVRL